MSNTIKYNIEFYSYWHCGSGLAAGASADALVVKDEEGLPFVPGKTIKGLVRECVEEFSGLEESTIDKMFGTRAESEAEKRDVGQCYFSNATLSENERNQIVKNKWQLYLYKNIASTSIDENTGVAKEGSLRTIEVAIPCTLEGEIVNVPEGNEENLKQALLMIKRLGANRNRGLGRCNFKIRRAE